MWIPDRSDPALFPAQSGAIYGRLGWGSYAAGFMKTKTGQSGLAKSNSLQWLRFIMHGFALQVWQRSAHGHPVYHLRDGSRDVKHQRNTAANPARAFSVPASFKVRLPRYISQSIGLTQAITVLVASLLIGLALSTVQLAYTFQSEHRAAIQLSEEILTLGEGGATTASWTLDQRIAEEVVNGVIALGDVQTVTLRDEAGEILASSVRSTRTYSRLTTWFAKTFIGDSIRGQRTLSVSAGGKSQTVGVFSIVLAPEHIAERFVGIAIPVLIAGAFQALAIGLVLLWLSSRLVTTPLRRAASAIKTINPENPSETVIDIAPTHENNELGYLLRHTNKMVNSLSSVQRQLRLLATHDPLTKLPNRSCIFSRLERALARARRCKSRVAVLFIDLDNFKIINDSQGHSHGDALLAQVAMLLRRALRANDSVGRLGGDEFLVVVEDIEDVGDVVRTVQRIESNLSQPVEVGNSAMSVHCSTGIAVFPDDGDSAGDLVRHADMAMYQAKEETGNQFHFFAPEMSERMQARLTMEAALRAALDRNEFTLAYQPKFETRTGLLAGCEALLRWQRDERLLTAGEFVKIAEQSGIIVDIGRVVLEQACKQARDWAARFMPIPVAVNVSAQQLHEPDFVDHLLETTARHNIEPGMLELEITETVLIKRLSHVVKQLDRLREAGIAVSIDDFGTGYSSLSYLTHLPASSLKIDRSFVSGPQSSEVVLTMIIAMAKALRLTTVAEGVESESQRASLASMGCDVLQGYLLGRPMRAKDFERQFLSAAA